jgi:hypothetical protein
MALYAIDDLDDALDATRAFLLPFDLRRWLRLAVLAFFVAGGTGGGGFPTSGFQTGGGGAPGGPTGDVPADQIANAISSNLALIVGVVALALVVGLVFAWLSATFEFALLDALRTDEVRVRRGLRGFSGKGTRLFAFRLVLGLVGLLVVVGTLALAFAPLLAGQGTASVFAFLAVLPVLLAVGVALGVVNAFTTAFVAPIMLLEDRGVLSGWRRLWPVLRRDWKQFLAFAAVGFVLTIAVGILVGLATAAVALALAIPFALVAGLVLAVGGGSTASLVVLGVVGAILGLLVLVALALVQVPVQSYLRYWALLVLGDVDDDLDLVPERRAEVRAEA